MKKSAKNSEVSEARKGPTRSNQGVVTLPDITFRLHRKVGAKSAMQYRRLISGLVNRKILELAQEIEKVLDTNSELTRSERAALDGAKVAHTMIGKRGVMPLVDIYV